MVVKVKPLSVNRLYQGRRFRTPEYNAYKSEVLYGLMGFKQQVYDQMEIKIVVGLSNRNADLDNCCKAILDILQDKFQFNDSHIYKIVAQKVIVAKGQEYFDFAISPYLG